jgi:hypothetical protein
MTKIQALEKTIYNLENDVYPYYWYDSDSCNCGILAKTILNGKKPREAGFLKGDPNSYLVVWGTMATCMKTGLKMPEAFQALHDAGFTYEEVNNLEKLSDKRFCISGASYKQKSNVIAYMKKWVKLLKEQEVQVSDTTKPIVAQQPVKTVYVSVPISLTEQSKELILQ